MALSLVAPEPLEDVSWMTRSRWRGEEGGGGAATKEQIKCGMQLDATNDKLGPIIICVCPPEGPQRGPADLGVQRSEGCWEVSRWAVRVRVCACAHSKPSGRKKKKWEDDKASGAPVTVKVCGSKAAAAPPLIFPSP